MNNQEGGGGAGGPFVRNGANNGAAATEARVNGRVTRVDGSAAKGTTVLFREVKSGGGGKVLKTKTDDNGFYELMLPPGVWHGMPCGSAVGWLPVIWEITSAEGEVRDFRELRREAPRLTGVDIALTSALGVIHVGDTVSVAGGDFGCSGRVVVEVDGLGSVDVTAFAHPSDTELRFPFPAFPPPTDGSQIIIRKARFTYVQGPARSNTVGFEAPRTGVDAGTLGPPQIHGGASGGRTTSPGGAQNMQLQIQGRLPAQDEGIRDGAKDGGRPRNVLNRGTQR